jgi:hypothetical protein
VSKIKAKPSETGEQSRFIHNSQRTYVDQISESCGNFKRFYKMPESNFDIDRLGMLTLQHFEYGVESDRSSSGGENCYSNSEHGSNTSSPTYLTDDSESPLSSPTELKHSVKFWEQNEDTAAGIPPEDVDDEVSQHEESTCRYRRGNVLMRGDVLMRGLYSKSTLKEWRSNLSFPECQCCF